MSFRVFFRCVAEAVLDCGLPALLGRSPFTDVLWDVTCSAFDRWHQRVTIHKRDAEVVEAAAASLEEVRRTADDALAELRRYAPEFGALLKHSGVAERVRRYLSQVPMQLRQAFRRPADPSGVSKPTTLSLFGSHQLLGLLPSCRARFQPGDRPVGNWVLTELLGASVSGEVWKARDAIDRATPPVALRFGLEPQAAAALRQDAAALARLRQLGERRGLVTLHHFHPGDPCCLQYEFVEAADLAGLMAEWMGNLPFARRVSVARTLITRLAEFVGILHRLKPPLVHGHLQPANVLVQQAGKGVKLWVADPGFGLVGARLALADARRPAGPAPEVLHHVQMRGAWTPLYASPQQQRGDPPDPRDDVHALGVLWYQLMVGHPLATPSKDYVHELDVRGMRRTAVSLLGACVAGQAGERPRDARELAERLAALDTEQDEPVRVKATVASPQPAAAAPAASELRSVDLGGGLEMKFAPLPPGSFLMGSSDYEEGGTEDESPQHTVTITRGFHLSIYPVTQAQWQAIMGSVPEGLKGAGHPVTLVSWLDCLEFCRRLRQRTGGRYRLPSEAEWEYACRAGTTTPFHFGETISADLANYYSEEVYGDGQKGKYRQKTSPAGIFPPNAWALHDLHGNVYEWCEDWYHEKYYNISPEEDPAGPRQGTHRVIRGGAWSEAPALCRSAARDKCVPSYRVVLIGFRVVMC
jgi:formylglycine-generating enzyme required for sulfatase activity